MAPQQFFDNCDAVVTWTTDVPLFSSGTSTGSDISGAYFEKGTTIVTYTITESSDIDGNGIKPPPVPLASQ
ncbi:MAG: hypothetical protein IPG00_12955 [Saprospiraceae bacterium]|nr:hypothetical protein [Saprospiraceae bacterium]